MKHIHRHLICLLAALAMVFGLAAPALAEDDPAPVPVNYMRYDPLTGGLVEDAANCIPIEEVASYDDPEAYILEGWYVVDRDWQIHFADFDDAINLIIADGVTLTITDDMVVSETLNIYGQSEGTGKLIVTSQQYNPAIRIYGTLNIHGGDITATSLMDYYAPAIGWRVDEYSGELVVYDGKVTANARGKGPGIGGYTYDSGNYQANSGKVTVYGGEVIATGGDSGAGIGGGAKVNGCEVTVYGGKVIAEGGESASGIGGGYYGHGGSLTVYGGEVTASGGEEGCGIGGGHFGQSGTVVIRDGTVKANGDNYSSGIGYYNYHGYTDPDVNNVTISGGTVEAYGGLGAAGIGGGYECDGIRVEITGGSVKAVGNIAAGIGGGAEGDGGDVTISGGSVTAIATMEELYAEYFQVAPQGIGHGANEDSPLANGELNVSDGLTVMGGADGDSLAELSAPYADRPLYMTVDEPAGPAAETVSYRQFDPDRQEFTDQSAECLVIDGSFADLSAGWYVVNSEVEISDRIQVSGAVNLILADGAKLNAQKGIHVLDPDSLTIFGQTEGSGELIAVGEEMFAGIGMDNTIDPAIDPVEGKGGSLTVHGGKISATGGTSCAGIGGGYRGHGGKVTIYGGEVTATGGSPGAGIGGGYSGNGGVFTMYGGKVTARGGTVSAGIGGGQTGSAGEVTIYGGTIDTTAGNNGAGIGSGMNGRGGNVTIYDGNVTATGSSSGVAIGSGAMDTVGVTVKIYDGTVTANGNNCPGIGGGTSSRGFTVEIYGGTVVARGDNYGMAGIGGASGADGGTVRIFGGDVSAYGSQFSSGIGGGVSSTGGTVEISGGKVLAVSPSGGAGIGTGIVGQFNGVTITGGDVTAIGGSSGSGDNIRYAQGIGRGAAAGTSTVIPLTVGENMAVLGGADAGSLELLEAPYNDRPVYMTVKEKPIDASFVWDLEGDVPAATLVLEWANGNTTQIPATVTYSEAQGVGTFTAVAEADGVTYTDEKSVTLSYTVALTGGEITSGAKDSYAYGDSIIVTAGPAPEGKSFAGWYLDGVLVSTAEVYGRVIDRDLALEARFEDQPVEVKPTVVASSTPRVPVANSDNYKTSLSVSWSVPQGYALVEAGIYRAYAGSMPTAEKLLSKGTKKVSTLKNANGVYKLNVTMGSNKNVYGLYYIGYVTYKNASGQTLTEYSEIGCDPAIVLIS